MSAYELRACRASVRRAMSLCIVGKLTLTLSTPKKSGRGQKDMARLGIQDG